MDNKHYKCKIAFVAPSAYLLGGVQVWLDYLIPGLEFEGWDVTLVLTAGVYHNPDIYLQNHPFKQVYCVQNPTGSQEGRIVALASAFRDLNPDVILTVNIVDTYLAVERLRAKRYSKSPKVVMTLHGTQADFLDDINRYSHIIDAVVGTNKLLIPLIKQVCDFDYKRLFYAPYGVEIPTQKINDDHSRFLSLVYVGRFEEEQKQISDIPLILAELEKYTLDFKLTLAGSGLDEEALRSTLAIFGNKIEFKGVLSQEELSSHIYQPGAILLLTSTWETGPLVAWEAMSHGLVLVTSQYIGSGIEGSLRNGENCLMFPVGDVKAAAAAIFRLQDSELRQTLSNKGRELVCQRYSRASSIQAWQTVLTQILALPPKEFSGKLHPVPPLGRLDKLLGNKLAERIRQILGIKFQHESAGGEWPHSYGINADKEAFINCLKEIENLVSHREL